MISNLLQLGGKGLNLFFVRFLTLVGLEIYIEGIRWEMFFSVFVSGHLEKLDPTTFLKGLF